MPTSIACLDTFEATMTSRHRHDSQRLVSMTSLLLMTSAMSLLTCMATPPSPFNPKRKSRLKPPLDIRPHYNQIFQVEKLKDKILRGLNLTTEPQPPTKRPAQSIHSVLNRLPPPRNRTRTRPPVPDTIVWSEPVAANVQKADQLLFRMGSQKSKSSVINRVTLLIRLRFSRHSKSKDNGKVNGRKKNRRKQKDKPKVKSLDVQRGGRKGRGKKKSGSKQKKNKLRSKRRKSRRVKVLVQAVNEETGKFKRVVVQRVTVSKKFTWIKIPIPVSLVSRAAQSANQSLVLRIRCRRCLKTGVTIDNALPRKKNRKADADAGSFLNLNPNRPYMVICTADTPLATQSPPSLPRSARHVDRVCPSESQPAFSCCSKNVEVVFKDIGWDQWIVYPKSFTTVVCHVCQSSPKNQSRLYDEKELYLPRPAHTPQKENIVSSQQQHSEEGVIHKERDRDSRFRDRRDTRMCQPKDLSSLTVMYHADQNTLVTATIPQIIASSCVCTSHK